MAAGQYVKASLKHLGLGVGTSVTAPIGTSDLSSDFARSMNAGSDGLWYANLPPLLNPSIKQFLGSCPSKKLILQYIAYNTLQDVGSTGDGHLYFPS